MFYKKCRLWNILINLIYSSNNLLLPKVVFSNMVKPRKFKVLKKCYMAKNFVSSIVGGVTCKNLNTVFKTCFKNMNFKLMQHGLEKYNN